MIRPGEVERVHGWVQEAVADGAELISGGEPVSETCYPATVLFNPPADTKVSCQEVFGPIVCVYEYEDMDRAIAQANALPYAFQAAVFTDNLQRALRGYKRLNASAVISFTASNDGKSSASKSSSTWMPRVAVS